VTVTADERNAVRITSPGLEPIASAPPLAFDGPGNLWSPETLVVAAVADCFTLTFRAIAKASRFRWNKLLCEAVGTVDRSTDGVTRFIGVRLRATLALPAAGAAQARNILEKTERSCLVGNSLKCELALETELQFDETSVAPSA
jgi:organic hydroperoxide reductase OsmC/OhrA